MIVFASAYVSAPPALGDLTASDPIVVTTDVQPLPRLVVRTDRCSTCEGDTVAVSGFVEPFDPRYPVTMRVFGPLGQIVAVDQVSLSAAGRFAATFISGGPLWRGEGTYRVVVNYGANLLAEAPLEFPGLAAEARIRIAEGSGRPGCQESESCYLPHAVSLAVGGTVEWINDDAIFHTVTSGMPDTGPDGAFDSRLIGADGSFSNAFREAGAYPYFCMVHPWMTGVVTVKALCEEPVTDFVVRELPAGYAPGVGFVVILDARPAEGVGAYAVEDSVPFAWTVAELSHQGIFDTTTHEVKFGPFFDALARRLTYRVTPPANAAGTFRFEGVASADGLNRPIGGDAAIGAIGTHPADDAPEDFVMRIEEVTAYGAAWKRGEGWPRGPDPIPVAYVARAAHLWQGGESYWIDPSLPEPPLWWVNDRMRRRPASREVGPFASTVVRTLAVKQVPEGAFAVVTEVIPAAGVWAYAVEERAPGGWSVTGISNDGAYDSAHHKVKWGPFFDDRPRRLSYRIAAEGSALEPELFTGTASFDGVDVRIGGDEIVTPRPPPVPYDAWRYTSFGEDADDLARSGPYADFNQDGVVNIVAYAMGLDPLQNQADAHVFRGVREGSAAGHMAVVRFPRSLTAGGVHVVVEGSDNLVEWRPVEGEAHIVDEHDGVWMVEVAFPWEGTGPVYCRLKIE